MFTRLYVPVDEDHEYCFYLKVSRDFTEEELRPLFYLLRTPSFDLDPCKSFEVGPRLTCQSPWSSQVESICQAVGLSDVVVRVERAKRSKRPVPFDEMTEQIYSTPLSGFHHSESKDVASEGATIPLNELPCSNEKYGWGWDAQDLEFYTSLFRRMGRDPTDVECFDLAQSNSEHSRHWFFNAQLTLDGVPIPHTLFDLVRKPWLARQSSHTLVAFSDNASVIRGSAVKRLWGSDRQRFTLQQCHLTFTAETHNFPSGVAPFQGGTTGTGGRIRDQHAVGRGGDTIAGTAGYCVSHLQLPDHSLPWEDVWPNCNLASAVDILIQASNGASDYGNKFGEPIIQGFVRSFGLKDYSWLKPIMFTGGIGQLMDGHQYKDDPEKYMLIVKLGGPAYRIGVGGGSASSQVGDASTIQRDQNAVQRGDPEMAQRVHRVIRACVNMGKSRNPIRSIHDQGAGGNANVLKELVSPLGGQISMDSLLVGDSSLTPVELWIAEYQENDALLIHPDSLNVFDRICKRERAPYSVLGTVEDTGRIQVTRQDQTVVDLELKSILGELPDKSFSLVSIPRNFPEPDDGFANFPYALRIVLTSLSVGSKRFLTSKVDRSVTGLIAQQQCVGPLHLPLADVAVVAHSHFAQYGGATSIGERPILSLLNPAAMARMSVAEAVTNIMWAKLEGLKRINCSGNWMWAAKEPGEGARLYQAACALSEFLQDLEITLDGGKDSLSMAARSTEDNRIIKGPGTLVGFWWFDQRYSGRGISS
jgi:phosphoribosylformylglycinamidine synthase